MDRKGTVVSPGAAAAVLELRTPRMIRERAESVLAGGLAGNLEHFTVRLEAAEEAVKRTLAELGRPTADTPPPLYGRWRDFEAGGRDRWSELSSGLVGASKEDVARARFDLAITSALLGADTGDAWSFHETESGTDIVRSEGVAVGTFRAFQKGLFSSRAADPLRCDAAGLSKVTTESLGAAFPSNAEHALHALEARAEVLRGVGDAILQSPHLFGQGESARLGGLYDVFARRAQRGALAAKDLLSALLEGLAPALPGRVALAGVYLGDVWPHPAAGGDGPGAGLVPIHRIAQLAAYSLIEPLADADVTVAEIQELTALPDVRTGGLLVDTEVLTPKTEGAASIVHEAGAPIVVEWRALTVALLERIGDAVRAELGVSRAALPIGRILPAMRKAGRALAQEKRDGLPPIRFAGDGALV
jgi:hypothetical protein